MFIAMNRFKVIRGEEDAFEQVWLNRDVHLDGVDGAGGCDLRGLDGDRTAAGTDIPDNAPRPQVHFRQGQGANFGRSEQPLLGTRLQECFVGISEQSATDGIAGAVGGAGLADQDHHVE